jgi:RNA polymerase sigma factor (sigma-70 family)
MKKSTTEKISSLLTDTYEMIESDLIETLSGIKNMDLLGEQLYKMYYVRIYRYFNFRVFDKSEAEDLAQTVFLKIFASLKKGLWEGTGDICYIFTVARNTLIDYFRRNKHASIVSDDLVGTFSDSLHTEDIIVQSELREQLLSAMQHLRKEQAEAVKLRYFSDLDYPAIAKLMQKKEDAVRQLVHRGLASLKANMNAS